MGLKLESMYLVCDFGGTQIRAARCRADGEILERVEASTPAEEGPERVIEALLAALREAAGDALNGDVRALGVAAPGPLNPYQGIIYQLPNLTGWRDVPLQARLEEALGLPVRLGNDANLAALGEFEYGVGREVDDLIYMTISTGIGGGVVSQGQLIQGEDGLGTEIGHMVLEPEGPSCGCGKRGCLESLAAGPHIARRARERVAMGAPSSLSRLDEITSREVAEHAKQGDPLAVELWTRAAGYIGLGITNLAHIFNCRLFVLGGGVSNEGDFLFDPIRRAVEERTLRPFLPIQVVGTSLGDNVGLMGALAYIRREVGEGS